MDPQWVFIEFSRILKPGAVFHFLADSTLGRVILRMELYLLSLSLRPSWRFLRLSICGVYKKSC